MTLVRKHMGFVELEVGKPIGKLLKGTHPLNDQTIFDFNRSGGLLIIIFRDPTETEIKNISEGQIRLGLLEKDGIIFMLSKFGRLNWMDSPYHVDLSNIGEFPEATEGHGYLMQVVLVDRRDQTIKKTRIVAMPTEMSKKFKAMVEKQHHTLTPDYNLKVGRIMKKYSTNRLVKLAELYNL